MFTKGTGVKIRPEWRDEGDSGLEFVCVDDESRGRVTIQYPSSQTIKPTQVVLASMLEESR